MPLTALDPRTALVLVDLQRGIVARPTAHPAGEVVERAALLADAFRRHGLPVVLVNVEGLPPGRTEAGGGGRAFPAGWAELVPALSPRPPDHRVTKRSPGAFAGTDLEAFLRAQGVTQVVLAGISTSFGVESTAREAYDLGFNVTLATDAMTDTDAEAHANSLARVFPRIGETGATREVIDLLERTRPGAAGA